MAEYDLEFASKLAAVANEVDENDPFVYGARRTTLYLSRLSIEIALKALLEIAGVPLGNILTRSHDLVTLLEDLSKCEVEVEISPGVKRWCSASCVRAAPIDMEFFEIPIGKVIDAEKEGASKYPNKIRYGETVVDFHPHLVAQAALVLSKWTREHRRCIRVASRKEANR